MSKTTKEQDIFESAFPTLPWRQPLPVNAGGISKLVCRICLARWGLKAHEINLVPYAFDNLKDWEAHMRREHYA